MRILGFITFALLVVTNLVRRLYNFYPELGALIPY